MHVAQGMYGLILVEPEAGLPRVDREDYVTQGEFYTKGRPLERGHQPFDHDKARDERPEYVVFNGRMGALLGERALRARVGDTVRRPVSSTWRNGISRRRTSRMLCTAGTVQHACGGAAGVLGSAGT